MEPTQTQTQNEATDKKQEWANLSDEEEEDQQNAGNQDAVKKPKTKKKTGQAKPQKKGNNIFDVLDVEEDEDEPEQKKEKKENSSVREFASVKKEEAKPQAQISKKEQKKKELEEFDKILNEFKTEAGVPETAAPQESQKATEQPAVAAAGEGEAKKKKKKKTEKKAEEKAEEKAPEEEKQPEGTQPTQHIDVEKRIQEIIKAKAKPGQGPKKQASNLDNAKQEILARQQKEKKSKKKYEDL